MLEREILRKYLQARGQFVSAADADKKEKQMAKLGFLVEGILRDSGLVALVDQLDAIDDTSCTHDLIADVVAAAARRVVKDRRLPGSIH